MPIKTSIWKVASSPQPLAEAKLANEGMLEKMIVADPRMISDELMLIGRQENTGTGGRIDLLAIAPDGSLVLVELKRDRTPREVVAQALDYASWVQKLRPEEIDAIYRQFAPGKELGEEFKKRYGRDLSEDSLNASHRIIIVAGSLDEGTERIIKYLSDRDVPINVMCFQVFNYGSDQILSRSWLLDPIRVETNANQSLNEPKEPWNGEFYVSFGDDEIRSWEEARKYGFVSGGGGAWYSRTLQLLNPGDRIWVNIPREGYVGVGKVKSRAQPFKEFTISTNDGVKAAEDALKKGSYHRELENDLERCEYFVSVEWLQAVSIEQATKEIGFFGNQNTVCKPTSTKWRSTVERLREKFQISQGQHGHSVMET